MLYMYFVKDLLLGVREEENRPLLLVAKIGDRQFPLLGQTIVDNILYLLNDDTEKEQWNGEDMEWFIRCEAEDSCWKPEDVLDGNQFLGCEVRVCDGYFDDPQSNIYEVEYASISDNLFVLNLVNEEAKAENKGEDANSRIDKSIAELSKLKDYESRLGYAVYNAVVTDEETCFHIGRAILHVVEQHKDQLKVIDDTLIAVTGWGFESLKREMEDKKDAYYSLIASEEE